MTEQAIALEIRRLAREELSLGWDGPDGEELAGRLDSLALLSLVVAVEDRFRLRIGEEEGTQARSLADLAHLVAGKLARGEAADGEDAGAGPAAAPEGTADPAAPVRKGAGPVGAAPVEDAP